MHFKLDHLAICATNLAVGTDWAEALLGVSLAPGGEHPLMGTHNRLLSLGGDAYLEIIAINPVAPHPAHARWFDLDRFSGPPRLTNWIVAVDDLPGALAMAPLGTGEITNLSRGDLSWQMAIPPDGCLPFNGASPALIKWLGAAHPASRLPDQGVRLVELQIEHPDVQDVRKWLEPNMTFENIRFRAAPAAKITAILDCPLGRVVLA
jgi:hypothetical protein